TPYLPYVNGPDDPSAAERDAVTKANWEASEAFMAECMKKAGFVYFELPWTPEPEVQHFQQGDVLVIPVLQATREETARVGYGVLAAEEPSYDPSTDPVQQNEEYRDTLSEAAQAEYDLQRWGPDPYEASPAPHDPGCAEQAYDQYVERIEQQAERELSAKELFDQQFTLPLDMTRLVWPGVNQDPRVASMDSQWSACMADRGYDLAPAQAYLMDTSGPWAAWYMALRTKADGTLGDAWYNFLGEELTPVEERSLLGTPAEIQIALDDFDCRQEVGAYEATYREVQLELEAAFVEEHRQELDEMVAFVEQAG
ncbi:MAG: hypothetical protein LBR19_00490, partial [Bifidobacteriaceae bacterium]|nr:hypothetical protein [Bifidobacteriaceae bacterium]